MKEKISITLDKSIIKNIDSLIDRIFIRNRSQAIEKILKSYLDKNKTAVILLGGPEEKLNIGKKYVCEVIMQGRTLIERQLKLLREKDFKDIYIIARKKILESIFSIVKEGKTFGVKIKYIEEKEANGSADSLRLIRKEVTTSFLVLFGDIIFDKINISALWEHHIKNSPLSTLTLFSYAKPEKPKGEVIFEGNKIIEFKQKPKKKESYIVFAPVFVCEPEILYYNGKSLERDIFSKLAKKRLLNGYMSKEEDFHIHTKADLIKANKIFK